MYKSDVLKFFKRPGDRKGVIATANALGVTRGAVSQWDEIIPELTARQLHERTKGKLKFRPELYRDRHA